MLAFCLVNFVQVGVASASNTAPPFSECPQVGESPSCEILLIVNPDNTVSVVSDPAVGPYDGGDDTLVGIINNSSSAVDAVTVTGDGTGLGGLDGDGLCTYGVSGCPFGSTGYEGPNTKIVTDSTNLDSAEIDFTGGLAPKATAYFSLEGALNSAELTARKGHLDATQTQILYLHGVKGSADDTSFASLFSSIGTLVSNPIITRFEYFQDAIDSIKTPKGCNASGVGQIPVALPNALAKSISNTSQQPPKSSAYCDSEGDIGQNAVSSIRKCKVYTKSMGRKK